MISNYPATIRHMAGNSEEHELIDALSRSRGDQDDDEKFAPIDPKDAQKLYSMLTLPPDYEIDKPMLKRLLECNGLPSLNDKKKKVETACGDFLELCNWAYYNQY